MAHGAGVRSARGLWVRRAQNLNRRSCPRALLLSASTGECARASAPSRAYSQPFPPTATCRALSRARGPSQAMDDGTGDAADDDGTDGAADDGAAGTADAPDAPDAAEDDAGDGADGAVGA